MGEVIAICGQPKSREDLISYECSVLDPNCAPHKAGELWLYDFGPTNLTLILTLCGNRLAQVDHGDYGQ